MMFRQKLITSSIYFAAITIQSVHCQTEKKEKKTALIQTNHTIADIVLDEYLVMHGKLKDSRSITRSFPCPHTL